MNVNWFIGLCLLLIENTGHSQRLQPNILTRSTKANWLQGVVPDKLLRDAAVKKRNGVISLAKDCALLQDSHKDADYYEHEYLGNLAVNHNLKVVRRQFYNGNEYVVVDARNGCKNYVFNGQPYGRNTLLVNFDETRTTDRSSSLYVWQITPARLVHVKRIALGEVFPTTKIRFSVDGKKVLFADEQDQYWAVAIY